ncbi:hypothetical protein F4809DRAFT_660405 [Biscogniauxia mediterranea]|nr:hypothetical protein F4809DRAFT_660405 [Biscogniauxia mediterranea]
MKLTTALVALAGAAGAISSLADLEDGLYVVLAEAGYPDFSTAVRVDNTTHLPADQELPVLNGPDLEVDPDPDPASAESEHRGKGSIWCGGGKYSVDDYRRARAEFELWMERGQCRYARSGSAAVGACSYFHANPVCKAELDAAMRGADRPREIAGCGGGEAVPCAVRIALWNKYYCRVSATAADRGHKC